LLERPKGSLISYFSNRVKKEGGINLAQGTPGFPPPTELLHLLKADADNVKFHQYAPGNGNFRLLELLEGRFSALAPIGLDNLLVVQGATEGIFLAFFYLTTLLERPYSVLSLDPVYESYPRLAGMFNIPFLYADFEPDLSIDFDKLERTIKTNNVGVVFVTSPGNPLGKTWNRDEMSRLMELSRAHDFYIIFDAVYKDIYFGEEPFNPLSFNYEKLFYIDSFSKMLSITGWRIGYMITSKNHMERIRGMHDYTGLCAPSILQESIARYLSENRYGEEYIKSVRSKCRQAYSVMKGELDSLGFQVAETDGGYFMWARLPETGKYADAFEFALSLYKETGVGVVPGENFSETKSDYIRMNIGTELSVIHDAIERIKNIFLR
jgi:aspartate/methionine/tyrosine aminotransferase